jgi:hypothetical protein
MGDSFLDCGQLTSSHSTEESDFPFSQQPWFVNSSWQCERGEALRPPPQSMTDSGQAPFCASLWRATTADVSSRAPWPCHVEQIVLPSVPSHLWLLHSFYCLLGCRRYNVFSTLGGLGCDYIWLHFWENSNLQSSLLFTSYFHNWCSPKEP